MNGCAKGFLIWVVVLMVALVTGQALMRVWGVRWFVAGPLGVLFGCGVIVLFSAIMERGEAVTREGRTPSRGHPLHQPGSTGAPTGTATGGEDRSAAKGTAPVSYSRRRPPYEQET